jgi:hypothetical protein
VVRGRHREKVHAHPVRRSSPEKNWELILMSIKHVLGSKKAALKLVKRMKT